MSDEKLAKQKPEDQKVTPGWYVFQDGQIKGPLSSPEAFSKHQAGKNQAARFVSKVGFQKWYPVEQVQPVLGEVEKFATASKANAQTLENVLNENLQKLQKLSHQHMVPPPPTPGRPPQKKIIGPEAPNSTAPAVNYTQETAISEAVIPEATTSTNADELKPDQFERHQRAI